MTGAVHARDREAMRETSRMGRIVAAAVAVAALSPALASCGRSAVPADDIEQEIQKLVLQAEGQAAEAVTCPEPLPAKIGSSIRCEVTSGGGRMYGVTVKATSVEGEDVNYTFNVYDDPPG